MSIKPMHAQLWVEQPCSYQPLDQTTYCIYNIVHHSGGTHEHLLNNYVILINAQTLTSLCLITKFKCGFKKVIVLEAFVYFTLHIRLLSYQSLWWNIITDLAKPINITGVRVFLAQRHEFRFAEFILDVQLKRWLHLQTPLLFIGRVCRIDSSLGP